MKRKPKGEFDQQIRHAQMHLVEKALIGWLERLTGRVITNAEALKHGRWAQFAPTPLTVFRKDNYQWSRFYVWKGEHACGLEFDPEDLLCLRFVELKREEWPAALKSFVENEQDDGREKGPE